jgi:23S rRNA (cytosine1962-C5)-methyltransferase
MDTLLSQLEPALAARQPLLGAPHHTGLRLFNGFLEGRPELVADLYADTLVLHNHAAPPDTARSLIAEAQRLLLDALPWVRCVVIKERHSSSLAERQGQIAWGDKPAREMREHGVRYALDPLLNQDTSFYLDTRLLRAWAIQHLAGKTVLNTFAYTGSLGVAALAGGASRVVQVDRNRQFLNLAKTSYTLNGFPIQKADFLAGDFFPLVGQLKRSGERFDCAFLDPPFFSVTAQGTVDLVSESQRLVNKVRPLLNDNGWLVAINNALFVSGADYLHTLEALCSDGYLAIEALIPVPEDCAGYPGTVQRSLPADPAPFNHATKIAVLRVRRKLQMPHMGPGD